MASVRPEVILCTNDETILLDLDTISDTCPPVLGRLLNMSVASDSPLCCFKEAARDDQGRLTFAKHLNISRSNFQACITFLKTGHVDSIEVLIRTMDILGGSEKLDAYVAKKQIEREAREDYEMEKLMSGRTNPMTPEADIDHLYIWRAAQTAWLEGSRSQYWSVTVHSGIALDYWWRQRAPQDDNDEMID